MMVPIASRSGEKRRGLLSPERGMGWGSGRGSGLGFGWGSGLGSGLGSGGATGAASCGTGAPQFSQNLAPSGMGAPHCSQNISAYFKSAAIMMMTRITTSRMRCFLLMKLISGLAVNLAPAKSSFMLM